MLAPLLLPFLPFTLTLLASHHPLLPALMRRRPRYVRLRTALALVLVAVATSVAVCLLLLLPKLHARTTDYFEAPLTATDAPAPEPPLPEAVVFMDDAPVPAGYVRTSAEVGSR